MLLSHVPCLAQARNRSEDESQTLHLGTQSSSNKKSQAPPLPYRNSPALCISSLEDCKMRPPCGDHSPIPQQHPIQAFYCREEWHLSSPP